ncbi:MAG: hypothetical protein UW68_C0056G0002 [Candidatus Collierbacteria bacterium GW2011_GWB1_44_6]|uniref:Uncharacterized protein n=2 Tax=Candidatus Collieribacteriota TaxID=1752725 RepID=A0A0G1JJI8_9BACT|nr:MAG: hypothetical protein UV68_C0062G0002 [Candidatus Collierbacteria bacterium GW2011_GWC2_43_12]KKT71771.1 MAG: hypothetical protein UW68_C0056G0002 [Candidatus Collierbacteria bacterium GW2011_GWB1_44_6]KKT81508.1 MAG: hypothetical protein UW80_C0050G0002 [Microgenomates group bacterium GW2011_GWC1_44_9]
MWSNTKVLVGGVLGETEGEIEEDGERLGEILGLAEDEGLSEGDSDGDAEGLTLAEPMVSLNEIMPRTQPSVISTSHCA